MKMYFDDCERLGIDDDLWNSFVPSSWTTMQKQDWVKSMSEEKQLAIEKLLGYNPSSASKLSNEQIEEETLRWAVDTNIVWVGDDDDDYDGDDKESDGHHRRGAKYGSIKDIRIASSCNSILSSMAYLWNDLVNALEEEQQRQQKNGQERSSSPSSSVRLIVFPQSNPLWEYDSMVNMLLAVQISKPFLPPEYNVQFDLFHPKYKRSPRMWSPEMHSPFPTVGISITENTSIHRDNNNNNEIDIDATRAKLDAIFQSMDANPEYILKKIPTKSDDENEIDHQQILRECLSWFHSQKQPLKSGSSMSIDENHEEWMIETHKGPFQLYKTLWNTILALSPEEKDEPHSLPPSSTMIVVPLLDSHTLHRVAVTVNTALIRLDIPVRITQLYTPTSSSLQQKHLRPSSPYCIIQLSPFTSA
jgi:hypothetical protein